MFIAALFVISKKEETTQVSIKRGIDKQNVACLYKRYSSATKKNKGHMLNMRNLRNVMLSERSQTQKANIK